MESVPKRRGMGMWWKTALLVGLAGVLFVVTPSVFVAVQQMQSLPAAGATAADNLLAFTLLVTFLLAASRLPYSSAVGLLVSLPAAAYYLAFWFLMLYWQVTGHQFDVLFALDADQDVYGTLVRTLGSGLGILAVALAAVFASFVALFWGLFRSLRDARPQLFASWLILIPIALQALGLWVNTAEQRLVVEEIRNVGHAARSRSIIAPLFPDNSIYSTDSRESIFILQLESGNALAVSGELELDGKEYAGDYMPQTRAIARDGVFLPRFWSNSIQSNRALINILCGVTNNLSRALSYNPDKIVNDCLPRILRRSGYRTAFFVGFSALDFMNYGNLIPVLGFQDLWDSRITGGAEGHDDWGVDDCRFYRAMFDVLRRSYSSEPLFVYAEVSSHHFPFPGRPEYDSVHPFRLPGNFLESYLNSYAEQDHCLGVFYEEFRRFAGDHAHLIVVPDHSWPVGIHGNTMNEAYSFNENFLVPFVYVPPASRKEEFRVGERSAMVPAHTDLLPTIFDLLNDRSYPNSFAFALRRDAGSSGDYEHCQVLVQPYGGGEIAIVRGSDKYVYHVASRVLLHYDLDRDWEEKQPEVVARDIPYSAVRERYYCKRYAR